jgi:pimeloyl-ACP methyl ester carboxylesterase
MRERSLLANGLRFHLLEDGPSDGPLCLLLHGFPEFSYSWRHQLPSLAARGLCAVAPDLRGYHLSDKPRGVAAYDIDRLAEDVVALVAALGAKSADLVGHDWGGAIAWHVAMHYPSTVRRLAVLDCPPAPLLARALLRHPGQVRRSAYMFFFQLPWLPERLLTGRSLRGFMRGWAGRNVFSDEDLDRYVAAAGEPGAMEAALNYYRAAFRRVGAALRERPPQVRAPTLVLWGEHDRLFVDELLGELGRYVAAPLRVEVVAGAGHFLQQEAPTEVNRLLGEFLVTDRVK